MANYTTADIKALREKTGAGMLDVKKALDEADGDLKRAEEILQVKGQKGVAKREGRTTSNGLVALKIEDSTAGQVGTLIEIDCETDFVAKGEPFQALADKVLAQAVKIGADNPEALLASEIDAGTTVQQVVDQANAAIGEKIVVSRVARVEGEHVTSYVHKTSPDLPPQIGVLIAYEGSDEAVARDVAMHIAAMSPTVLTREQIAADIVDDRRRVFEEMTREEGKPEQAVPKIVEGRVNAFFKENVLLEQEFTKDAKKSVAQVLKEAGATATNFARFKVGV
ncbi:MAG: translation elongation factor Ts [Actinomycetales bacterium]|jgi:elongation factor Ts